MKQLFLTLFLFLFLILNAQKKRIFQPELSLFYNIEKGIDNNQLSEAHKTSNGFGIEFNILNYKNIKFATGFQYNLFSVVDYSMIGNYKFTRISDFYTQFSYHLQLSKKFSFEPLIQISVADLKQIAKNRIYNTNSISSDYNFNFGCLFTYQYNSKCVFYIKPLFIERNFNIKTPSVYENFFNKNKTFGVNIGVKWVFQR